MVKGLEIFREWFAGFADQYVLIGGTAAALAMAAAGADFRSTKDLDIVLHVEALTPAFGAAFWAFVEAGGYAIRQRSDGRPVFYRFQRPAAPQFPAMLELFARSPVGLASGPAGRLTPIPIDDAVSSLSAILLDEAYYDFVLSGRKVMNGLPWIGEDRLIPLKALAWLDLSRRRAAGESIDAKDIRKHANDVLRLATLLLPSARVRLDAKIADDLDRFLEAASRDDTLSMGALGLPAASMEEVLTRISATFVRN